MEARTCGLIYPCERSGRLWVRHFPPVLWDGGMGLSLILSIQPCQGGSLLLTPDFRRTLMKAISLEVAFRPPWALRLSF